jgi:phospholipase C
MIISPWSRRGYVAHQEFDHTSVLRMIEWRWGLPPLTVRDAEATNLAEILDFRNAKPRRPLYDVPDPRVPTPCGTPEDDEWLTLASIARIWGWLT